MGQPKPGSEVTTLAEAMHSVVAGPRWYRLLGAVGLALSLIFMVGDYRTRKNYREWRRDFMLRSAAQQPGGDQPGLLRMAALRSPLTGC
jgi:hypothetical protein